MREVRKPKAFIGSSTEALGIAYALQENLEADAEITVWSQGIFEPSNYPLESLLAALDSCDLGIFVFSPDDMAKIRGAEAPVVRDNVLFELGLFVGRLGRHRSIFLTPKGTDLHIPSDLLGVIGISFVIHGNETNLNAALGPAANRIRNALKKIETSPGEGQIAPEEIPEDLKLGWFERRAIISPTQQKLLSFIEDRHPITDEDLKRQLPGCSETELHYRTEQLRLLGFVKRIQNGRAISYRLTEAYDKAYSALRRQKYAQP